MKHTAFFLCELLVCLYKSSSLGVPASICEEVLLADVVSFFSFLASLKIDVNAIPAAGSFESQSPNLGNAFFVWYCQVSS